MYIACGGGEEGEENLERVTRERDRERERHRINSIRYEKLLKCHLCLKGKYHEKSNFFDHPWDFQQLGRIPAFPGTTK